MPESRFFFVVFFFFSKRDPTPVFTSVPLDRAPKSKHRNAKGIRTDKQPVRVFLLKTARVLNSKRDFSGPLLGRVSSRRLGDAVRFEFNASAGFSFDFFKRTNRFPLKFNRFVCVTSRFFFLHIQ